MKESIKSNNIVLSSILMSLSIDVVLDEIFGEKEKLNFLDKEGDRIESKINIIMRNVASELTSETTLEDAKEILFQERAKYIIAETIAEVGRKLFDPDSIINSHDCTDCADIDECKIKDKLDELKARILANKKNLVKGTTFGMVDNEIGNGNSMFGVENSTN